MVHTLFLPLMRGQYLYQGCGDRKGIHLGDLVPPPLLSLQLKFVILLGSSKYMTLCSTLVAGADCKDTPVPDPHHFKIVDVDTPKFVSHTYHM